MESGGDPPCTLRPPRLQSLLAYLVLHRDIPQLRQYLAFLFFPDSSEAQARTNLRHLLYLLHQALPREGTFVVDDGQCLYWRANAPFALDVERFESALQTATTTEDWQTAVALYRGDLVPGCYEDWILPERERLRALYLGALEQVSTRCEEVRDYIGARRYSHQLSSSDPLREETYRRLMRLAALSGDRAGVERDYRQCMRVLASELQVEPSAETKAAFQEFSRLAAEKRIVSHAAPDAPRLDNLPLQLTSFTGRDEAITALRGLVPDKRLVTLTGAGGVGKTRLVLAVAEALRTEFADGAWLVDFASLADHTSVPQAVATVLNVQQRSGDALVEHIANFLRARQVLVVLDNCEHLIEPVRRIAERLIQAAPRLHILATSRQSLGVAGEYIWRVPPLAVPQVREQDDVVALMQYPGVQLFVERARHAFPPFALTSENADAVIQICQRLDGIPLALELAAARVDLLDAREIAVRLKDEFHLLSRCAGQSLPHQQTLRATIDWSYNTLSEPERVLFRRLAVFAGGFDLDAAEAVCTDAETAHAANEIGQSDILDLLSNLIDKSLVVTAPGLSKPRTRLLEPIREYAREKLSQADELKEVTERHLRYFLGLASQSEELFKSRHQKEWLSQLALEYDNLRAALESSQTQQNKEIGMQLAAALIEYWTRRGYLAEGQYWLTLTLASGAAPTCMRARLLSGLGTLKYMQGCWEDATACHAQALALFRECNDVPGIILSLSNLGVQMLRKTKYAQAQALFEQSLEIAREQDSLLGIQRALHGLGACALNDGEISKAQRLFEEALELARRGGDDREVLFLFFQLGGAARLNGDIESSAKCYQESLTLARELKDKWSEASALIALGLTQRDQCNLPEASALVKQALHVFVRMDCDSKIVDCLEGLAQLSLGRGNAPRAARLFSVAQALRQALQIPLENMDRAEYEQSVTAVQAQLGDQVFRHAWAEGGAMSKSEAIAYALADN